MKPVNLTNAIKKLEHELATVKTLLAAAYRATDHVAIAGSYDNLKEGQRYIIEWRRQYDAAVRRLHETS